MKLFFPDPPRWLCVALAISEAFSMGHLLRHHRQHGNGSSLTPYDHSSREYFDPAKNGGFGGDGVATKQFLQPFSRTASLTTGTVGQHTPDINSLDEASFNSDLVVFDRASEENQAESVLFPGSDSISFIRFGPSKDETSDADGEASPTALVKHKHENGNFGLGGLVHASGKLFKTVGSAAVRLGAGIKRFLLRLIRPILKRTYLSDEADWNVSSLEKGPDLVAAAVKRASETNEQLGLMDGNLAAAVELELSSTLPKNQDVSFVSLRSGTTVTLKRGKVVGKGGSARVFALSDSTGKKYAGKVFRAVGHLRDLEERIKHEFRVLECLPEGSDVWESIHKLGLALPLDVLKKQDAGEILPSDQGGNILNLIVLAPLFPMDLSHLLRILMPESSADRVVLLNITQQMVAAVGNLHRLGLVHLDIKPRNFLVSRYGRVYLSDLDEVKQTSSPVLPMMYSPNFVSPELAKILITRDTDAMSTTAMDAWQLGVSIYVMWCNAFPNIGLPPRAKLNKILSTIRELSDGDVRFDPKCTALMPSEVETLIRQFIAADPEERLSPSEALSSHPAMLLSKSK